MLFSLISATHPSASSHEPSDRDGWSWFFATMRLARAVISLACRFPVRTSQQRRIVIQSGSHIRMFLSETCLTDVERAPKHRFGVGISALQQKDLSKIVHSRGDGRMIRSQRLLLDGEGPPVQGLSFAIVSLLEIQSAQAIDDLAGVEMVWPQEFLVQGQGSTIEGFCLGIPPLCLANIGEGVQRSSKIWMFSSRRPFREG